MRVLIVRVESLIYVRVSLVVRASDLFWVRHFTGVLSSTARAIIVLASVSSYDMAHSNFRQSIQN